MHSGTLCGGRDGAEPLQEQGLLSRAETSKVAEERSLVSNLGMELAPSHSKLARCREREDSRPWLPPRLHSGSSAAAPSVQPTLHRAHPPLCELAG